MALKEREQVAYAIIRTVGRVPTVRMLAAWTGFSYPTTYRALQGLRQRGLIGNTLTAETPDPNASHPARILPA